VGAETVYLETIDGVGVEADLIRSDAPIVRAIVVIGHPHPLHGGDRFNHVVQAMQRAAAQADCHSIAVDFRGVGNSGGFHDNGDAERLDLAAACELADLIETDCPIIMSGYSFGSVVGLNVSNPWIAGWIAIAPPVSFMASTPGAASSPRPKILVAPEHDQFTSPEAMRAAVATWKNTEVVDAPGVDHFIAAGSDEICSQMLARVLETL
jgi:alpha/beta superfamily hydrolase